MKLIMQIITKKLEAFEEAEGKNEYQESFWNHSQVYNIICAIEQIDQPIYIQSIWLDYLKGKKTAFLQLKQIINNQRKVISDYYNNLTEEEMQTLIMKKYRSDVIAVQDI